MCEIISVRDATEASKQREKKYLVRSSKVFQHLVFEGNGDLYN